MPKGWRETSIGEITEKIAMGPFGSSIKVETFVPDGVPIISGQHLRGFRVNDSPGFNFITEEHARRLANANVHRGDVVFTHAGNIGQAAYISEDSQFERYVISQRQFYLRCDRSQVLPEFVTLYFRSPQGQHQLLANTSQVGVPSIAQPVTYLRTIPIPLPPIQEQRAIARVLGALDDKIELNRRMNETLEAMAQALFKSWFVNFEPVRAKLEGRWRRGQSLPGLPADYFDLFPDRLVDSEVGKLPAGWELKELGDLAETIRGRSYRSVELVDSDTALVTLKSFARGGGYRAEGLKSYAGKFKPEQIVSPGELVIACTDVTQAAEVIGRPAIVQSTTRFKTLVASLDTLIVRPRKSTSVSVGYLYCLATSPSFVHHTTSRATGTTVLHLAKDAVSTFKFPIAPRELLATFSSIVEPAFCRMIGLDLDSRATQNLRDSLLPKLISGELRVPGAERVVESVA